MDTGVLPVGRFPNVAKRSSCELGSLGSYFFLLSCIWITREIIATMTMQKVSKSSHVTIIVPPFNRGQKKHHPRKNRGEPPTGALLAAPETAYHTIRQIARKKSGAYRCNAMIRPAFEFIIKTEFFIMYRYQPWKASSASLNAPYAPASLPRDAKVNRAPLAAWNTYLRK